MSTRPDPITWVIDWMVRHHPEITRETVMRCEREARAEYGGEGWAYFARQSDRQRSATEKAAYTAALTSNAPMQEIASQHGVSRSTMYRLLKRGPTG